MDDGLTLLTLGDKLEVRFLGKDVPYGLGLSLMQDIHQKVAHSDIPHQLLLLEHKPVITVTRSHLLKSVTSPENEIKKNGIDIFLADRGGDATFHGPGQLVGYPLFRLNQSPYIDLNGYIRLLEGALINSMHALGLTESLRVNGYTGVWVPSNEKKIRLKKLIAIGVGVKDGVSKHGFALNITIDPKPYLHHIIPCGLNDRGVVTLEELYYQKSLEMPEYSVIVETIAHNIAQEFSLSLAWALKEGLSDGREYCHAPVG
jgi:lipoyl(octanoyl) transferase